MIQEKGHYWFRRGVTKFVFILTLSINRPFIFFAIINLLFTDGVILCDRTGALISLAYVQQFYNMLKYTKININIEMFKLKCHYANKSSILLDAHRGFLSGFLNTYYNVMQNSSNNYYIEYFTVKCVRWHWLEWNIDAFDKLIKYRFWHRYFFDVLNEIKTWKNIKSPIL